MEPTHRVQSRDNGNFQLAVLLPRLVPVFIPLCVINMGTSSFSSSLNPHPKPPLLGEGANGKRRYGRHTARLLQPAGCRLYGERLCPFAV